MRFPRLLAVAAALSPLVASPLAEARDCAYWSGNGPSVYSMQQGLTPTYAAAVDQAGMGGLRMGFRIDTQASWDQALFDQYDALLETAAQHGLDVMAIVLYESTPPSAGGQAQWNSGYDSTGYSAYVQAFVDTAKTLMDRYGDRIKYWEIWNEPNAWTSASYSTDPTTAGGTYILPEVYAKLLAETYVQNEATITSKGLHLITGGLFAHDIGGSFSPATDYAQQLYASGVWDWMQANVGRRYPWDGFGYHVYIDQGGATSSAHLLQYIDAIQQLKVEQSDYVPLWITEFGWQAPKNMTPAQQAANIGTALATFEARGDVARTFVFKVDDYDDWGIFDGSWAAKPAVATYQAHDKGCAHLPLAGADGGTDAGADADAGAGAGAGASTGGPTTTRAGDAATSAATPSSNASPGGCGCTTARASAGADWLAGLVAAGLLAARRIARRRDASGLTMDRAGRTSTSWTTRRLPSASSTPPCTCASAGGTSEGTAPRA